MEPIKIWSLAMVALFLRSFLVVNLQGFIRIRERAFVRPEDAAFYGRGVTPLSRERPLVERAQGVLRNDTENIPYFAALSLAYIWLNCSPTLFPVYVGLFVASRYAHTLLYLWPRQPWRTAVFGLGLLTLLALTTHVTAAALG